MRYGALLLTLFVLPALTLADEESFVLGGGHKSRAFAYEIDVPLGSWFKWSDLEDDYQYADAGFLGIEGYGAVLMPVCWEGSRPTQLALLEVFMERFGEDYPTPFVQSETDISKGDATGTYLVGNEPVDDEEFTYHFWIVSNDNCAYNFAAWGPAAEADTAGDLQALWKRLTITDAPAVLTDVVSEKESATNAFFLNQIGTHYFDARSYRDAFRFLSLRGHHMQATKLDNAIRVPGGDGDDQHRPTCGAYPLGRPSWPGQTPGCSSQRAPGKSPEGDTIAQELPQRPEPHYRQPPPVRRKGAYSPHPNGECRAECSHHDGQREPGHGSEQEDPPKEDSVERGSE